MSSLLVVVKSHLFPQFVHLNRESGTSRRHWGGRRGCGCEWRVGGHGRPPSNHRTHAWSLAVEEAVAYSLARGKAAAVARESGEVAAYSLARETRRRQSLVLGPLRDGETYRQEPLL